VGDKPLDAVGFDISRGVGKHDFQKYQPVPSDKRAGSVLDGHLAAIEVLSEEDAEKRKADTARIAAVIETRLKDDRALIFSNLLNGVPVWQVCRDFHRTESDVMNIFRFILRKIKSRRLERMEPPIVGNAISEIQKQRIAVLTILPKLNLDKDPLYKNVFHEPMEIKQDGTVRHADFLKQLRPVPEHLRMPPIVKP
jgi:hypothetical protein